MQLRYIILITAIIVMPWVWNGVKFVNCDFESDWKCEAIHGAGIFIPPASYITVWFDDDSST